MRPVPAELMGSGQYRPGRAVAANDAQDRKGRGRRRRADLLLAIRDALRSDVPNHRLSTLADMDVLDADILIAAMTLPAKSLDLPRIGAQQPSRSRRKRHHPPVSAAATSESRKNRKGRGVCAGHLNGESSFDFILWRGSLDQGKGGVHTDFRNPAGGQSSRRL